MTSKRIAQTNQQQKSEKPQGSGILQRAAVRSVSDAGVQLDEQEALALTNSTFSKDFSQVPISTAQPQQTQSQYPAIEKRSANEGDQVIQRKAKMTGNSQVSSEVQRSNKTGLPDRLKTGIENLSGISMNNVKVHYNSSKPAQLQALAYTQGTEIHVAPGQEEHLPHETWHVVQQMRRRVKPTMQMKGVEINDDEGLEREADVMGMQALARGAVQYVGDGEKNEKGRLNFLPSTDVRSNLVIVQRVKAKVLDTMPPEVKEAVEFLNLYESDEIPTIMDVIKKSLSILENSEFASHCDKLIKTIKLKIPEETLNAKPQLPTPLTSQKIHGIWVQGDYKENNQFLEGLKTRKNGKAAEWQNLIWVYDTLQERDSELFSQVNGIVCKSVEIEQFKFQEVDFVKTIEQWKEKPEWVQKFIPIFKILLEKKSYITMSDIMRMIILYYQGGLYQDVKIHLSTPDAKFFDEPLVNADKLQLVRANINEENWAMVAQAGCKMIAEIMEKTLEVFPGEEELKKLPINYAEENKYSRDHVDLHENKGPWPQIVNLTEKTDTINDINPSLKLKNPNPVNSWAL